MRSYERNQVVVDQCTGCKGIFLDRGELERLIHAEGNHYEKDYSGRQEEQEEDKGGRRRKSKKRSFLEGLLEGGGE
ncbi:MAG: zf-TFIIB domain-containing protein [Actinobacteria bacterium]|nr:zf-TFIIB domain-containing protein [Actinomycetota bacterium]